CPGPVIQNASTTRESLRCHKYYCSPCSATRLPSTTFSTFLPGFPHERRSESLTKWKMTQQHGIETLRSICHRSEIRDAHAAKNAGREPEHSAAARAAH